MATNEDYLPENPEEFKEWMINFNDHLPGALATKYGIDSETLAQLAKDTEWTIYWVQGKLQAEMQKSQINDYFITITQEPDEPQPAEPTFELPPHPPVSVPPGIRRRVRNIVSKIKGQKAIFSETDGELLGIMRKSKAKPANPKPSFDLETRANFFLLATFVKGGFKSIRFEYQRKGENTWHLGMIFTSSPGEFQVMPAVAGVSEQILVRAIYLEDDQPVGEYSDIKTALIAA